MSDFFILSLLISFVLSFVIVTSFFFFFCFFFHFVSVSLLLFQVQLLCMRGLLEGGFSRITTL